MLQVSDILSVSISSTRWWSLFFMRRYSSKMRKSIPATFVATLAQAYPKPLLFKAETDRRNKRLREQPYNFRVSTWLILIG